jgi:hypothetical protein
MTGHNYADFLQNGLPEQLRIARYSQQDLTPTHYTRLVMQHLSGTFPDPWICRGSTINWPPTSPDLTPLDFCLWGWLKSKTYGGKVNTQEELLYHIMDIIARIKQRQDVLRRATRHVLARVAKCIDVDGGI